MGQRRAKRWRSCWRCMSQPGRMGRRWTWGRRIMKNSISNMTFATLPKDYEGLVRMFPLRPIHDKVDLDNAAEITDAMAGHKLNRDQEDYFSVLATLIDAYEQDHRPQPRRKHDPLGNLIFLMEQHQMNA